MNKEIEELIELYEEIVTETGRIPSKKFFEEDVKNLLQQERERILEEIKNIQPKKYGSKRDIELQNAMFDLVRNVILETLATTNQK